MNVFVVVTTDGEMKPYIANNIEEAVAEHDVVDAGDLDEVVGVFVYGKHEQLIQTIEAFGMVEQ